MTDTTRVVVVDDHPLFRDAIVLHLRQTGKVSVVAGVATVADAKRALAHAEVDVVVSDLHLPDGRGTDLIAHTDVPVLVLSADERPATQATVRSSGARGMLSKTEATGPALLVALDTVLGGGTKFPDTPSAVRLTRRERDVLGHIAKGRTTSEAATQLGLSPNTVRTYIDRIFRKLSVSTRAEAVTRAAELGELAD